MAVGRYFDLPKRGVLAAVAGIFLLFTLTAWVLPEDAELREVLGTSPLPWLVFGGAAGLVGGYVHLLSRARRKAALQAQPAEEGETFSPHELDRYARHIIMRDIGGLGQKRLKDAKVLVIGAGGLGSPALLYMAAGGVGRIGIIDDDLVDNSNLQRQVIHTDDHIGMPKVFSAEIALRAQNPHVDVRPYHRRLDAETARGLFEEYDLVLDGTDNFDTRYLVNRIAAETKTPLIAAAMGQWEAQISTYDPANDAPCYKCVFPEAPADGLVPSCSVAGVVGPLPGIVGSMMALEAIKEFTRAGTSLRGALLIYDAQYNEMRKIQTNRRADCPTCGNLKEEQP